MWSVSPTQWFRMSNNQRMALALSGQAPLSRFAVDDGRGLRGLGLTMTQTPALATSMRSSPMTQSTLFPSTKEVTAIPVKLVTTATVRQVQAPPLMVSVKVPMAQVPAPRTPMTPMTPVVDASRMVPGGRAVAPVHIAPGFKPPVLDTPPATPPASPPGTDTSTTSGDCASDEYWDDQYGMCVKMEQPVSLPPGFKPPPFVPKLPSVISTPPQPLFVGAPTWLTPKNVAFAAGGVLALYLLTRS